jgi:serine/threonine protein kinase
VGKYKLLKTIGKGNFAKVKLARHIPTGQEVGLCIHSVHHGRGFTTCLTNVLVQTLIGIDCVCV